MAKRRPGKKQIDAVEWREKPVEWENPRPKIDIEAENRLAGEDPLIEVEEDEVDTERGWLKKCIEGVHDPQSLPTDKVKYLQAIEKVKGWSKKTATDMERMSDEELIGELYKYAPTTLKAMGILAVR
jgi:hypothetical protein